MKSCLAVLWFCCLLVPSAVCAQQPVRVAQTAIDVNDVGQTALDIAKTTTDPGAKCKAMRILARLKYEPSVPFLVETLSDTRKDVRGNAAYALGDMQPCVAVKPLIELLEKETDGGVIASTAGSLGRLGAKDALPTLRRVAKHEYSGARAMVLGAVRRLGDKRDIAFLAQFLDDLSVPVQTQACLGIEEFAGIDLGVPKRQGLVNPYPAIGRAKVWWAEHKGEYPNPEDARMR